MEQKIRTEVARSRLFFRSAAKVTAYGIVGGWSALFLLVAYCFTAPLLFHRLVLDAAEAELAGDFFVALGACVLVASSSLLLLRRSVRGSPRKWLAFFYGFEAPMVMLIATRLFLLREITAGAAFVFASIMVGCVSVAWHVHKPFAQSKLGAHAQLLAASLGIVASVSLAAYLSLYVPVAAVNFLEWIFSMRTWQGFYEQLVYSRGFSVLWVITGTLFFIASATFLLAAPFGMMAAHVRNFRDQVRYHRHRFQSLPLTVSIVVACVAGSVATWTVSSRQDAKATLDAVDAHMKVPTVASLEKFYAEEGRVKAALLDAYLAPYRYLGAVGSANHLQELYGRSWLRGPLAEAAQTAHNAIARPFLYDGASLTADQDRAAAHYEQLFDAPIQRAERETIAHAFSSTYERLLDKAASSVVDMDAKHVLQESQDVSVRELGGAAEITIHDSYKNLTNAPQEVLYYFELPEDAVVTGLWLGNSPDKTQAFVHRVAPRGAAQRVYKTQVRRRVDPALVEQVGPRQYRLRAYPVQVDRPLHLWMSYAARPLRGELPRPKVLERRNVFADARTQYAFAGTKAEPEKEDEWVRVKVPSSLAPPERETVMIGGQLVERIALEPSCDTCEVPKGSGERIAIIVDRSRSMNEAALTAQLAWASRELNGYSIDVILSASDATGRSRERRSLGEALDTRPLGSSTFSTLFATSLGEYTAAFVITDDDGYDRAKDLEMAGLPASLWMIHLGNPARAYPDAIGDALARRGSGVASTLHGAFERWLIYTQERDVLQVTGRDAWVGRGALDPRSTNDAAPMEQIAAKMWISAHAGDKSQRANLHALAQAMNVVTPLSSMIVLVNDDQHKQLDKENESANRFDREAEDGKEKAPGAHDAFGLSATPEPEEWMLIFALLFCVVLTANQRRAHR